MHGRLFWKLATGNTLLIAAALAVCLLATAGQVDQTEREAQSRYLTGQASVVRSIVEDRFTTSQSKGLDSLVRSWRQNDPNSPRFTLVLTDGTVIADSDHDAGTMENHASRPEIRDALRNGVGSSTRFSATMGTEMSYVAVRVGDPSMPLGVVRTSLPHAQLISRAATTHQTLLGVAIAALLVGLSLTLLLAAMWTQRIRRLASVAQTIARGDLTARVNMDGLDEVAVLGRAVDRMTERIGRQIQLMDRQRQTLESLLSCLQEGVIIIAADGRIALYNDAAQRILGLPPLHQHHRSSERLRVEQWLPYHDLLRLLPHNGHARSGSSTAGSVGVVEAVDEVRTEIPFGEKKLAVLARASYLSLPVADDVREHPADSERSIARLIVLTDITDLERAIKLRTDFVANASHELRTPLSAIRAAVETLERMDLAADQGAALRFVSVIARHASRLESMVADLLTLSRVESGPRFEPRELHLGREFERLLERWRESAAAKSVRVQWRIDEGCQLAVLNADLLTLTLDNLLDNAIKFTPGGKEIMVSASRLAEELWIQIRDEGCGIPPEHQARVFERFYQIDPARAGDVKRGTGLGLSIVRHATTAMGGIVSLESTPGVGTCVTLAFPRGFPRGRPLQSDSPASSYP